MAETDNNNSVGGMNDPLKMRNTETASLKRMPASPNSAAASSAARKTIKLKPLVSASSTVSGNASEAQPSAPAPAAAPKTVVPPSFLLNRKPAAPQPEEPPKFMSTNTAPITKMVKPGHENPIPVAELGEAPTKTVSIPRLQARMTPKPAGAPVIPTVNSSSAPTVSVPKISKPAAPAAAAPGAGPVSTATVSVPKISKPATPPPTYLSTATTAIAAGARPAAAPPPTYISTATTAIAAGAKPATPTVPISANALGGAKPAETPAVSTTTQGIQRQAIAQAKMQSGLQGAKPAIKVRPSASPTQEPEALTPTSPTIKLSPKTESAVTPVPPAESADSQEVTVTTKIPRKTLQLKPKAPAAEPAASPAQAQLREQGDIANKKMKEAAAEGEQAITQQHTEVRSKKKGKTAADEPNIFFAICAILAFLVIGYMVFALTAQFLNTWEQKNIPVVGFQQIDESLKNK